MDKNVGNVDLEELKRAREELMQEKMSESAEADMISVEQNVAEEQTATADVQDIENNPNVSRVFERPEPQQPTNEDELGIDIEALVNEVYGQPLSSEDLFEDQPETNQAVVEEQPVAVSEKPVEVESQPVALPQQASEARDFSVYDSFAAFEVAGASPVASAPVQEEPTTPSVQSEPVQEEKTEVLDSDLNLDEMINQINQEIEEKEAKAEESVQEELVEEKPAENELFDSLSAFEVGGFSEPTTSIQEIVNEDKVDEDPFAGLGSFEFDAKPEEPAAQEMQEDAEVVSEEFDVQEPVETVENSVQEDDFSAQLVGSLSDLEQMLKADAEKSAQLDAEIKKAEQEASAIESADGEETEDVQEDDQADDLTSNIEPYKYVDVIDLEEFKNSDKLTYVMGKDADGNMHYGNLRDNYNLVVFGKENEHTNNFVHSILLSLILKNSVNEVNFVMCDSKANSKFEVYNKSSYMYFNRIAKTNKEILDILIELNKELEERYKLLSDIGVKSIEQYNIIAKNDNLKPLPYIVTVFNNYSKAIQLTESDKINTCLYQILKFGRIAGMYLILVANNTIMSNEINYNLPTRIAFKLDEASKSLTTLGEEGAENLSSDGDFLCSTVGAEKLSHLKVATLTSNEIELLIENIEE